MSNCYLGVAIVVLGCAAAPAPTSTPRDAHRTAPASGPASGTTTAEPSAPSPAPVPQPGTTETSRPEDEVCNGSIDASLQHQLAERAAAVRSCYEQLLRRDPRREGRLMVTVKLSEAAAIEHAWITLDELADPETADCALASFKKPLNGSVAGGCAMVNVPLRFKIKKPEPQSP